MTPSSGRLLTGLPRFAALVVLLLAPALAASFVAGSVWPGLMGYDGLLAFTESARGITTNTWPPMHAYLLTLSGQFPMAPGSVIFLQVFCLGAGGVVVAFRLFRSTLQASLAAIVYLAALVLSPSVTGTLAVHWRDPLTAAFFALAAAAWIAPPGRSSWLGLILGAAAATVCLSLRYNAFPVVVPLTCLMVYRVWRYPPARPGRLAAILLLLAPYPLAVASVTWRLPDLQRLPRVENISTTRLFDIVGVGACSGKSFLPVAPGAVTMTPPDTLRRVYSPVHANKVIADLQARGYATEVGHETLRAAWFEAVRHDPLCFLSHRRLVFLAQVGALKGDPFYITHNGIDPNPFGFRLARPDRAAAYVTGVAEQAHAYWNRPAVLLAVSLVLMLLSFRAAPSRRLVKLALALGAIGFTGLLFLVSPAADARYIVPALAAAALLAGISAADLLPGRRTGAP
jgi:hypothetical protein